VVPQDSGQWEVLAAVRGSRQQVERVEKEKGDCGLKKAGVNERREQGKCGEQEQRAEAARTLFMVHGQKQNKNPKRGTTSIFFLIAFLSSPYRLSRNAQKRNKKIDKGKHLVNHLDARTRKTIAIACLSPPYREAQKSRKKKIPRKNISPVIIFGNALKKKYPCFRTPLAEKHPNTH
jgi:hypothetical protein